MLTKFYTWLGPPPRRRTDLIQAILRFSEINQLTVEQERQLLTDALKSH